MLLARGIPAGEPITASNIGKRYPSELFRFIEVTEQALDLEVGMDVQPIQPWDVVTMAADVSALEKWLGFNSGVCCFSYFAE